MKMKIFLSVWNHSYILTIWGCSRDSRMEHSAYAFSSSLGGWVSEGALHLERAEAFGNVPNPTLRLTDYLHRGVLEGIGVSDSIDF